MKKTVKTVHTFIVFALTLVLVVLRSVQLCLYTDSFGLIVKGAESTIAAFYLIASLLFAAVVFGYGREYLCLMKKAGFCVRYRHWREFQCFAILFSG